MIQPNEHLVRLTDRRYNLVYRDLPDGHTELVRCIPHASQKIFDCAGTYNRSLKPTHIYIFANCAPEAKRRYERVFGWKATECTEVKLPESIERILTDPLHMPL